MDKNVVLMVAVYDSLDAAKDDFKAFDATATAEILQDVTVALVSRENGKLKVQQATNAGKAAAAVGAVGGVIVGALFPPAGLAILGGMIAGGATLGLIGGAIGHIAGGLHRKDLKELGDMLDEGEAAVIVVADDEKADRVDAVLSKAVKKSSRLLDKGEVQAALDELDKGALKAEEIAEEE